MAKIVSNQAVKWIKEHDQLSFTDLTSDEIEDEDEAVIEEVPPDILSGMIARLPLRYRVVVNLRTFERLSHKDVALRLGIPERTSIVLFYRAKRKLAKIINEYLNSQRT